MNNEERDERPTIDLGADVSVGKGRPRGTTNRSRGIVAERREQRPKHQELERETKVKAAHKSIRVLEEDYNYIMELFYEKRMKSRHEAVSEIVQLHKQINEK